MTILYRDNEKGNAYEAFKELNKCAFGIWFYLNDTRDNYITPNDLKEKIGIGRTQYYKAIEELVASSISLKDIPALINSRVLTALKSFKT